MGNSFSYAILLAWPLVSLLFYRNLPIIPATFWTIVGGYLVLPVKVAIDAPLIPPLNKESLSAVAAFIGCVYVKKRKISFIPKIGIERWLVVILLLSPLITVFNNREPIGIIAGLTAHDALSAVINQYLILLPFIIGLQLIKTYDDQLMLFKLLVMAGVIYSVFILFEIRMSPQLHTWVYGFFPHSFSQQVRFGGFRAVVFMGHGLLIAIFVALVLGAATLLWKEKIKTFHCFPSVIVIYFFVLLFLCKTVGAFLLGVFLLFSIAWMPVFIMKCSALFLIFVVLFYPVLLIFDLFPHQGLIDIAENFDVNRGESLAFRFFHEERLLEHVKEKIFFGWGWWDRNRLSDSITDGYWIIILGQYGIVGFGATFGLVILGVWRGMMVSRFIDYERQKRLLMSHALIIAIVMIDQLPNASMASWLWFLSGALLGRANSIVRIKYR